MFLEKTKFVRETKKITNKSLDKIVLAIKSFCDKKKCDQRIFHTKKNCT